jgi:hypothetical protein
VEVDGSHFFVVGGGEVLGEVVSMVGFSWAPDNLVLALFDAVLEPIKAHVDGFGTALFDGAIEDPLSTFVVCANWCGGLWVAQVDEGLADWAELLGIHEIACHFGLCC